MRILFVKNLNFGESSAPGTFIIQSGSPPLPNYSGRDSKTATSVELPLKELLTGTRIPTASGSARRGLFQAERLCWRCLNEAEAVALGLAGCCPAL